MAAGAPAQQTRTIPTSSGWQSIPVDANDDWDATPAERIAVAH
jgi:hypothetical protein